jgi:uncharacterized protein GlcG (DUF336 family)
MILREGISMPLLLKLVAASAAIAGISSSASGQAIVTQREISLNAARAMADAAIETCRKGNFRVSVTIVDSGGIIRVHVRDDGAAPHTIDASFKKAYTSRTYRVASADFMRRTEVGGNGRPGLRQIANVLGVPGGLPIKTGEETIGGIGVAGAPGDSGDESCAAAGIDKVKDQLN